MHFDDKWLNLIHIRGKHHVLLNQVNVLPTNIFLTYATLINRKVYTWTICVQQKRDIFIICGDLLSLGYVFLYISFILSLSCTHLHMFYTCHYNEYFTYSLLACRLSLSCFLWQCRFVFDIWDWLPLWYFSPLYFEIKSQ